MALSAPQPADLEALARLPDHIVGELIEGELYLSPRPALRHALAASALNAILGDQFQGRGARGWWILFEPELHFGPNVVVPDLAGWRRSRLPQVPADPFLTLAPDWVCELLSTSTRSLDRSRKLPLYSRQGVSHVWLIDPEARTLETFVRRGRFWMLTATWTGADKVRAQPFESCEIDLLRLWGEAGEALGAGLAHDAPVSEPSPAPRRSARRASRRTPPPAAARP